MRSLANSNLLANVTLEQLASNLGDPRCSSSVLSKGQGWQPSPVAQRAHEQHALVVLVLFRWMLQPDADWSVQCGCPEPTLSSLSAPPLTRKAARLDLENARAVTPAM